MSPKKSNGSWRGPCPYSNCNKSIWSLLGKGIGNRHFRLLTRKVESGILSYCLFHYAGNMLSMLLKCQFINSGLISIRQSNREQMLYILVLCILLQSVNAKPTSPVHYNEGHWCYATTCRAGEEAVACPEDWTPDWCRPCPADKYMEQDNVPSDMKLKCYTVRDTCMPDNQRLMQDGAESASNPPRCVCDTTRDYYQHGYDADDCRKMKCPSTETLLLNGTCACREGRVLNSEGECVWKTITDLTPLSFSTLGSTAIAQNMTTISTIANFTDNVFNTTSSEVTSQQDSESTKGYNFPSTTDKNARNEPEVITSVLVIVLTILFLIVVIFLGYFVYKCFIKKRRTTTTTNNNEDKKDRTNPLIKNVTIHKVNNLQVGSDNVMYKTNNNYNQLAEAEDSDGPEDSEE